ncbi:hypothetical protein FVE85_9746 [Porphyridium purpureum]|uniref:Uncharacterized protein n=1 Tax=Porphyridium purpureum TaxID=35688 RepID=A0A5J4YJV1_PORPP|nr:hypothetical protein FVE85_9746 [Porphyridium purpureum]|eukprot:POR2450..scf246_12
MQTGKKNGTERTGPVVLSAITVLLVAIVSTAEGRRTESPLQNIALCAVEVNDYNVNPASPRVGVERIEWSNCHRQLANRKGLYGCGDELVWLVKFDRTYGNPESERYDAIFHLWANSVTADDGIGFEYVISAAPNLNDPMHTAGDLIVLHDVDGPFVGNQEIMSSFRFAVLDVPQGSTAVIRIKFKVTCRPYATTYQNQQSVKLTSLVGTMDAANVDFGADRSTQGMDDYTKQIRSGTVPYFLKDMKGAAEPWLEITHLGVAGDESCDLASPQLVIKKTEQVKHCITVSNKGSENAVNIVLEDHGLEGGSAVTQIPGIPSVIPPNTTVTTAYVTEIDAVGPDKDIVVEVRSTDSWQISAESSLVVEVWAVLVDMNLTLSDCGEESLEPKMLIGFVGDLVTRCVRITNQTPEPVTITTGSGVPQSMIGVTLQPGESSFAQESSLIEQTSSGSATFDISVQTNTGYVAQTDATLLIDTDPAEPEYCWGMLVESSGTCYYEQSTLNNEGALVTECLSRPCSPSYKCVGLDPSILPVPTADPTSAATSRPPLVDSSATGDGTNTDSSGAGDDGTVSGSTLGAGTTGAQTTAAAAETATPPPPPADTGEPPSGESTSPGPIVYETLSPEGVPTASPLSEEDTGSSGVSTGSPTSTPTSTATPGDAPSVALNERAGETTLLLEKRIATSLDSNCQLKTSVSYMLVA